MLKVPKKNRGDVAKTRSIKQESTRAKKLGGYVTKGSGNGREKGDVRKRGVVRVECKTTTKNSFSVTLEMLNKIHMAAITCNELPVLEVEFIDSQGKVLRSVCIVPSYFIDEVFDAT